MKRPAKESAKNQPVKDHNLEAFAEGVRLLRGNAALAVLLGAHHCRHADCTRFPPNGWVSVDSNGTLHVNPHRRAEPQEWAWALAHCLLHLGFGHVPAVRGTRTQPDAHLAAARCAVVNRFLATFPVGRAPVVLPQQIPGGDEEELAARWRRDGLPPAEEAGTAGTAGAGACDQVLVPWFDQDQPEEWETVFAAALTRAMSAAMDQAGGRVDEAGVRLPERPWTRALNWFVSSYPLLGGIAAGLTIVADAELARAHDISVAAVDASAGEIYVNPLRRHTDEEWRFILGHEMLHAALRHGERRGGRDPFLFNVAADYVINGWLLEMGVGDMPDGLLHDPQLKGMSAEEVYDRIVRDQRRIRRLATLAGKNRPDVLDAPLDRGPRDYVDLDDFYRRGLQQGFELHGRERGLLPAGLVEEIRALAHPPLSWDAQLARWFDEFVPSPVPVRSYSRPARRQSATPDIPRAGRHHPEEEVPRCTFGVVLDTSGSMDRTLLGKALGAIASYAAARDVPAARVVHCDAAPHDVGYVAVEEIAGRVRVHGRGGTVLQPGIELLERAEDFPPGAPVLLITDGECDVLRVRREHAYLLPRGAGLPFTPRGPVFRVS